MATRTADRPPRDCRPRRAWPPRHVCSWLVGLALVCAAPSAGQPVSAAAASDRLPEVVWAERVFAEAVSARRVSGAVVVVADAEGRLALASFGVADEATGRPMEAERTRVLIASVTKTFTATAVAQLLDRGAIASLDDPANRYLRRVSLPDAVGGPVTVRDLLTHRGGLDIRGFGMVSDEPVPVPMEPTQVRRLVPGLVRPRGRDIVYSNAGFGLLGVLVEDVTGKTLQAVMRETIFGPLGMEATDLSYDPRPEPDLARPARISPGGQPVALAFDANTPFYAAAGSIRTTARDMAPYVSAQLRAARGEVQPLLSPTASRLLTTRTAANADGLPGLGLGFFLDGWNGVAIAEHAGGFSGFATQFVLVPERGIGMFAAWVGTPAGAAPVGYDAVRSAFLVQTLGPHAPPAPSSQPSGVIPAAIAGTYWRELRGHAGLEALLGLDMRWVVGAMPGSGLTVNGEGPYLDTGGGVFARASADGGAPRRFAFSQVDGRWRMASTSDVGWRVQGLRDPGLLKPLLLAALVTCLTGLLAVAWPRGPRSTSVTTARWFAVALGVGMACLPLTLLAGYAPGTSFEGEWLRGHAARFAAAAALLHLPLVCAIVFVTALVAVARGGGWSRSSRATLAAIHIVLLAIATTTATFLLWSLDVLGRLP